MNKEYEVVLIRTLDNSIQGRESFSSLEDAKKDREECNEWYKEHGYAAIYEVTKRLMGTEELCQILEKK